MHYRQTLAREAAIEGVALHSGQTVHMRLRPAAPRTGVVFVRTDIGGERIPATLDHAGPSFYATVIQRGEVQVSTIEHLMAALYALQVDDVVVELDGPEVPILDGSSRPFVDCVLEAGRRELDVERKYMTLVRPIVVSRDDKRITAYPCREYRVTYAIEFDHPLLGYQELTASLWGEAFVDKLSPARTFTFESDVERLRQNGLALGGSLDNAVVLGKDGLLNEEGLRFDDEFVRHKMLDLTGDLSLLGHPLRAHIVAFRAGHDLHAALAQAIWQARDAWYLAPWSEQSGANASAPSAGGPAAS